VFILGFSSIFTGLNFIVTMHKMRAPGMTWFRMPLFVWAIYATAIIQVLATPVLGITLLLSPSSGSRTSASSIRHGRRPGAVPALLLVLQPPGRLHHDPAGDSASSARCITVHSQAIFGYKLHRVLVGVDRALSFLVWGHHMFVSGQSSSLANMVFSALTFTVGDPRRRSRSSTGCHALQGLIRLNTPMLYTLGVPVAVHDRRPHRPVPRRAVDRRPPPRHVLRRRALPLRDDGRHARRVPRRHPPLVAEDSRGACTTSRSAGSCAIGVFIGFNLTFLPQFVMGSQGMPRRY
jgi:cytochrome c oxidase subunit 1